MSPFRPYSNRRHRTSIGVPLKKLKRCHKKRRANRSPYCYGRFLELFRHTITDSQLEEIYFQLFIKSSS